MSNFWGALQFTKAREEKDPKVKIKDLKKAFTDICNYAKKLSADDEKKWLTENKFDTLEKYLQNQFSELELYDNKVSGMEVENAIKERKKFLRDCKKIERELYRHKKSLELIKNSFKKYNFPDELQPDYEAVEEWNFDSPKPLPKLSFKYNEVVKYIQQNRDKYVEIKLNSGI